MMKRNKTKKVIFCDIDGTILDASGRLDENLVEAIRGFVKRGGRFVLASGRPYAGTKRISEELGINDILVCHNGAVIVDEGGEVIRSKPLLAHRRIISEGLRRGASVVVWDGDKLFVQERDERIEEYLKISRIEPVVVELGTVTSATKVLWICDPTEAELFSNEMQSEEYSCFRSKKEFLEFICAGASKGVALSHVCDVLGIEEADTVAIGDGENDVSMLRAAGIGVAVFGACDSAKKAAETELGSFLELIRFIDGI